MTPSKALKRSWKHRAENNLSIIDRCAKEIIGNRSGTAEPLAFFSATNNKVSIE